MVSEQERGGGDIALVDPSAVEGGFGGLLDQLDDAIVISRTGDLSGEWCPVVVHVNQAFTDLTGYTREEALGRLPSTWARPAENGHVHGRLRAGLESGECVRVDLVIARRDGSIRNTEAVIGSLGRDHEGRHYFIEVNRDATGRQARETFLAEAHDLASLGSWEWDIANDRVQWTEGLHRIFGTEPEELPEVTYATYLERVHPEDRPIAETNVARALDTGRPFASDYRIVKPGGEVRWLHSRGRVTVSPDGATRMVGVCQDITDRRMLEDALAHSALHDALTGLPNRALLQDRLALALERANRSGAAIAVAFVDFDRFKAVNDEFGHNAGDTVLTVFAQRLQGVLRPSDTVARYGGDEFVAVCDDVTSFAAASDLGERMQRALAEPVDVPGGFVVHGTASIGIAVGGIKTSADELVAEADAAMYAAKGRGGGTVEVVLCD